MLGSFFAPAPGPPGARSSLRGPILPAAMAHGPLRGRGALALARALRYPVIGYVCGGRRARFDVRAGCISARAA